MDHTTITDCYKNHICDYFHRTGGAGRYVGYEDWHPAVLTLGCAYQAMKVRKFSELQPFWSRLPLPIMSGCDDLRHKTLKLITANIDDTVVAVPFGGGEEATVAAFTGGNGGPGFLPAGDAHARWNDGQTTARIL